VNLLGYAAIERGDGFGDFICVVIADRVIGFESEESVLWFNDPKIIREFDAFHFYRPSPLPLFLYPQYAFSSSNYFSTYLIKHKHP
jgi:hypothetical protein